LWTRSREKLSSLDYFSPAEAQRRIKPPARLREALSSLGSRLESWGYYSRHAWESVCERFLGKSRPEEQILFAQGSVEESVRAKDMGINAAPVWGGKALSGQEKHTVGAVGVGAEFTTSSPSSTMRTEDYAMDSRGRVENVSSVVLPADVSDFVDKQATIGFPELARSEGVDQRRNASQKSLDAEAEKPIPGMIQEEEKDGNKCASRISLSQEPYYSLKEVRENLTLYSIESLCTRLLGEPHKDMSNRRHLRYGESGALAVSLSSSSLGLWKDHSRDEGGDIFKLVMRELRVDFKDALAWVAETLRLSPERSSQKVSSTSSSPVDKDEAIKMRLVKIHLKACQPVKGTLGERYLREHRGIQGELSSDLRFIPSARNYLTEDTYTVHPALVALARNKDGDIQADQLIFLDQDTAGKADCPVNKKFFGLLRGASIQIQKVEGAVFLAEGVETALSIREAGVKGDIYAVLGSENFKNAALFVDDKSRPVIICADQDGEKSQSGKVIAKALEVLKEDGLNVSVIRPTAEKGEQDFNDILKREGAKGVQSYFKEYIDPALWMSERDQRIFSYLQKAITEDPVTRPPAKEDYLHRALQSPDDMLHFWQRLTGDRSFMPDGDPRSPEELAAIARYQQKMATEREQMRQERLQKEKSLMMSPSQESPLASASIDSARAATDLRANESPQKIEALLSSETSKKVEASVPSSLQEGIERGQNKLAAQEKSLKLDTDVQRFMEVLDRATGMSALRSGESKTLWPVLDGIVASWKGDDRFTEKVAVSGNRRAAQYIEQYHIQQKRLQTKNQGYTQWLSSNCSKNVDSPP
jgi:hypothetical protein